MSRTYRFRVVNVFAESAANALVDDRECQEAASPVGALHPRLTGNPLAVIENAEGLSDAEMQQLALQFNLSESTFICALVPDRADHEAAVPGRTAQFSSLDADARVRIFTPRFEMPFAGHPTLGTAHVLRALGRGGDVLKLQMKAGVIPVAARGDVWTLTANAPTHRAYEFTRAQIAAALGLDENDIAASPLWVNAGVEQLIVPLASADAVARATPRAELCLQYCRNFMEAQAYVFAARDERNIVSRYFFAQGGALIEDPGTGSACANLGGYLLATKAPLPLRRDVHQGAATGRPCLLHLEVDSERHIRVGGRVIELMRGVLLLD
jgi:PhzF family phenazine biosynthesis protein